MAPNHIFHELRRRRVFRTGALYIVGSWLVLQVADVVFPALGFSDAAVRYVLFSAVVGFPVALVFGWFYDIGDGGIHRTQQAGPRETEEALPLRRIDYVILTALLTVAGAIIYNTVGYVAETPLIEHKAELPAARSGPPMVAVLPFTTTSREADDGFFAAGVHDDLLTQLSKLQSLRVISRTSVMEYKDVARNLRQIAAELGADVIMEGGVQIAGSQIRINAQLIDARNDDHLWAQTYDRELTPTNIFEVQSDISRAISAALRTTLTPQDVDQLAVIPTNNMAAYRAYREAMSMAEEGNIYERPEYREALEKAVDLDPSFTRAWAELAGHLSYINFWGEPNLEDISRAEEIIELLDEKAPNSADYFIALAYYTFYTLKDYDQAFDVIVRAEERAPSDLKILNMKTWILRRQGRHAERNEVFRTILTLDPKDTSTAVALVNNFMMIHQYDAAQAELSDWELDGYRVESIKADLRLREHGDFDRYVEDMRAIETEFASKSGPPGLWMNRIYARDFGAAAAILDTLKHPKYDELPGLSTWRAAKLITHWFLQDDELFLQARAEALQHLEDSDSEEQASEHPSLNLDLALIPALEGDTGAVSRLLRQWLRNMTDATEKAYSFGQVCQTYGMAGATKEAVDCIRNGLTEPSSMRPWIDPHLPFYDTVRNTPEFQVLMAELEMGGSE